jgi:hypothetical protein
MSKYLLSQLAHVEILSPRPADVLGRRSAVLGNRRRDPSYRETLSDASPLS